MFVVRGQLCVVKKWKYNQFSGWMDYWYSGIYTLLCQKFGLLDNIEN